MSTDLEARAVSGKKSASSKYTILKGVIDSTSDRARINKAMDYFFKVHESKDTPQVVTDLDDKQAKAFLLEIGGETVNRDYVAYVQTGVWGTTSSEMVRILKRAD